MNKKKGWLCYLSTDNYLDGVLVLAESLKRVGTKYPIFCMVVGCSEKTKQTLRDFGIEIIEKQPYPFPKHFYKNDNEKLQYWTNALDKLQIFSLYNEFEKFVYLDCDMMVFKNIDHLFNCLHITASQDAYLVTGQDGHKNFNAGLIVVEPKEVEWKALEKMIMTQFSPTKLKKAFPDGGCIHDQLILNLFYHNWKEVPKAQLLCTYNIFVWFADDYKLALSFEDVFVCHYTTRNKPFMPQVYNKYPPERIIGVTLKDKLFIEYIKLWREIKNKIAD